MRSTALLALLPALSTALTIPGPQARAVSATQFEIPTLKKHYMGENSGIANGDWPPGSEFNSTIDFTLNYPETAENATVLSASCSANWVYGTHPDGWVPCQDSPVAWRFTDFTSEGTFVLEVSRQVSVVSAYAGSVKITSDSPSDSSSWLTCLGGAPLDGIRCNLDGMLSSQKSPIPITVADAPAPTY